MHIVWQDDTNGEWGFDSEIMYSKEPTTQTSGGAGPINLIIIDFPDSSISLLSPLGLGIISIAMVITVIISVIITKKIKLSISKSIKAFFNIKKNLK